MGSLVNYTRPDGQLASGYLAQAAAGAAAPGIVVIQEWWGLNAQIKQVADRLAALGYNALVPDLYKGKLALAENEAQHLMTGLDFGDAASQDIRGAVQYLKVAGAAKVGVTGYCMGGALTLLSAQFVPEVDAAAIWYGYPPADYVDASKIRVPLMGSWGIHDDVFPIAGVDALEAIRLTAMWPSMPLPTKKPTAKTCLTCNMTRRPRSKPGTGWWRFSQATWLNT